MIDIITPLRFYQLSYKDDYEGGNVDTSEYTVYKDEVIFK